MADGEAAPETPAAVATAATVATVATVAMGAIARQKLAEIHPSYVEAGGSPGYWRELVSEVIDTALPQYARAAAAQTRLELASYGLWRQGDPLSRVVLGLAGLTVGGIIVKLPFIPVFEDAFAFVLAAGAFFYPEIRRWFFDWRFARLLNRLIVQAETYQGRQLPYVSAAALEAELSAVGAGTSARGPLAAAGSSQPAKSPSTFAGSPLSILAPPAETRAEPAPAAGQPAPQPQRGAGRA